MNRHERRKATRLMKLGHRSLRLRCAGCDRVGQPMTDEHFFPRWLIEYAEARSEGITWLGRQGVNPLKATIPLCGECNALLGTELEGPVSNIMRELDAGGSLSDREAEQLVRWMWKFEGLQWALYVGKDNESLYTDRWTLTQRVTSSDAFNELREGLVLAMARVQANDDGFSDWPLGLDTPPGENAITMSGVFKRIAILTSLKQFAGVIPEAFGQYDFGETPPDRDRKVFSPPTSFPHAKDAITLTADTAAKLSVLHDAWGRDQRRKAEPNPPKLILPARRRIELPPM